MNELRLSYKVIKPHSYHRVMSKKGFLQRIICRVGVEFQLMEDTLQRDFPL